MKRFSSLFLLLAVCLLPGLTQGQTLVHPTFEQSRLTGLGLASARPAGQLNIDPTLGVRLQAALETTLARKLPTNRHGVSASVIAPGMKQWSGAAGMSNDVLPMDTNLVAEMGSNTKTFTASLIMRLAEQGKLSLDDPLSKWLPTYPNIDSTITIRELLNHSSGVFDYINDDQKNRVITSEYTTDPARRWVPDDVFLHYVGPPNFSPGARYKYSNTNFMLLGVIAEKAGGESLISQLHKNFIDPLHLTHTYIGGFDSVTVPYANNWRYMDSVTGSVNLSSLNKTAQLTGSFGCGFIVATASDLARWCHALYTGEVVADTSLMQMMAVNRWFNGMYYGLGTLRVPYYTKYFYGHTGGMIGFSSVMYTNPADSVTVALYLNSDPVYHDITTNDFVVAILNEIYRPSSKVNDLSALASGPVTVSPNPATDHATFSFTIPKGEAVRLVVYDERGSEVRTLNGSLLEAGAHNLTLDATSLADGNYIYCLQTPEGSTCGKLAIVR